MSVALTYAILSACLAFAAVTVTVPSLAGTSGVLALVAGARALGVGRA